MDWHPDAEREAQAMLRGNAEELRDEAVREAKRCNAATVGPDQVVQAAKTVRLRRLSSPFGDVLLAIGPALATFGGGVGVVVWTSEESVKLDTWVSAGATGVALLGMLFTGAGIALKVALRR